MPDEFFICFLPNKPSSKNPASGSKGINNKAHPISFPEGRTWSIRICKKSFIIWYMALLFLLFRKRLEEPLKFHLFSILYINGLMTPV